MESSSRNPINSTMLGIPKDCHVSLLVYNKLFGIGYLDGFQYYVDTDEGERCFIPPDAVDIIQVAFAANLIVALDAWGEDRKEITNVKIFNKGDGDKE